MGLCYTFVAERRVREAFTPGGITVCRVHHRVCRHIRHDIHVLEREYLLQGVSISLKADRQGGALMGSELSPPE